MCLSSHFHLFFYHFNSHSIPVIKIPIHSHSSLSFSKSYQALFRINFASTTLPSISYPGIQDRKMNIALRIASIAFDAFFDDSKSLVADGVKADIKLQVAQASSQDERSSQLKRANIRLKALKLWLASPAPLSYGELAAHDTYNNLVRAVAPTENAAYHGLPGWNDNSLTVPSFVDYLLDLSDQSKNIPIKAPVLKHGSFLPVLKVARNSILEIVRMQGLVSQNIFLKDSLTTAISTFRISFFPYHKQNSRSRGAPHSLPVFDAWANLGARFPHSNQNHISDPTFLRLPSIEPETVAYNNAVASDSTAPWNASPLNLISLRKFLNRTTLPTDFTPPSLSPKAPYVDETYRWVLKHYDGTKHLHHLALLVAIIASSSFLPFIFLPQNSRSLFANANSPQQVRQVFADLPWEKRSKKGQKDKAIFIAMFTAFIIALYEPHSPLRSHMASTEHNALGEPWTAKHSQSSSLLFLLIFSLSSSFLSKNSPKGHLLLHSYSPRCPLG